MKNRLTAFLEAYRRRPQSKADQSMWQFVAERDPYLFSHHPPGASFREHVWKIGGLYFCKGCVVALLGVTVGIAVYAITGWLRWLTLMQVVSVFVLLLAPTLLVYLWKLPRWCKHVSRFLLGFLMASAVFMLFVTDSWIVRGIIVATYFAVKIPMERKRNRENRELARRCGCGEGAETDR